MKFLRLLVFCPVICQFAQAQSDFVSYDEEYYHKIERLEIKSGFLSNQFHDDVKPFQRKAIVDFLENIESTDSNFTKIDLWNLNYLKKDSWSQTSDSTLGSRKPFWKYFLKKESDFYHVKNEDFEININPIFQFGGGSNFGDGGQEVQYLNTRGIGIRGTINDKLGFNTFFTENQSTSPFFIKEYYVHTKGFPYTGFTKIIGDDEERLRRDYMQANGYLVFKPSKNINLRFGHSKNFIGSGVRSMILSDFSAPYLNLMVNVRMGRLEYQSILARMNNKQVDVGVANVEPIPAKYMAFHHLNLNASKKINIGLFETVMFGDRAFDLNYLNPVIFYRFVEGLIGSRDNAIVGADFKVIIGRSLSVYGQFVLDEFNSQESKEEGWYGEKNAGQLGIKYVDLLGIKQLDFQFEYNYARPYTYSHYSTYTNVVNYNLPIAHPLGANFKELLLVGRYQPAPKLFMKAIWMYSTKGYDSGDVNWGGDILKSYRENRPDDFGNYIAQGTKGKISLFRFESSYMLGHNFFLETSFQRRLESLEGQENIRNYLLDFGLRWNIGRNTSLF